MGYGANECPEDLPNTWEYYAYETTDDFMPDPEAGFRCK